MLEAYNNPFNINEEVSNWNGKRLKYLYFRKRRTFFL